MTAVKRNLVQLILAAALALSAVGYTVVNQHITDTVPFVSADESAGATPG